MKNLLTALKHYFDPPQAGEVTFKYYVRTGQCHSCGECCRGIHLVHHDHPIADEAEFRRLQKEYVDYQHFEPYGQTEAGLTFRCKHLTEDNRCGIYDDRPLFCKKYPSEISLLYGANLAQACGFRFRPKTPFAQVLAKTAQKPSRRSVGQLLFDIFKPKSSPGLGEGRILPESTARPAVDTPTTPDSL